MAFKDSSNSFSDIAITSRLETVNSFLKELDSIIDFKKLKPILSKNGIGTKNRCGVKAYDNILMFKALLVQKYYDLSDQQTEDQLRANILYMRFVGLSLEDDVPDHTTICRFRNSLLKNKLYDKLFKKINDQLEEKGLIAQDGVTVLVDASLIKSNNIKFKNKSGIQRTNDASKVKEINESIDNELKIELKKLQPSSKKITRLIKSKEYNSRTLKNAQLDEKQMIDSKDIKTSQTIIDNTKDSYNHHDKIDQEVRTGFHASKKAYITGYKVHVAVDEQSGIILKPLTTFANTSDIQTIKPFAKEIKNVKSIYADKAYKSKECDEFLKEKNIGNFICLKEKQNSTKEEKITQRLEERNKHKIRAKVEHAFAHLKTHMKYHTTRFIGLARNNMNFTIACLASNLKLLAHRQIKLQKI